MLRVYVCASQDRLKNDNPASAPCWRAYTAEARHTPALKSAHKLPVRARDLSAARHGGSRAEETRFPFLDNASDGDRALSPSYHFCESMFVGVSMQREFSAARSYSHTE